LSRTRRDVHRKRKELGLPAGSRRVAELRVAEAEEASNAS
jgi:hypothetical protein